MIILKFFSHVYVKHIFLVILYDMKIVDFDTTWTIFTYQESITINNIPFYL